MYKIEISKIRESNVTVFLDGDVDLELLECFEASNQEPLEVLSELVQLSTGKYSVEIHQQQPKEYTTYNYKKVEEQNMKLTEKYIVFRDKETGDFLQDYKSRGTLAYDANCIDSILKAAPMSFEQFAKEKEQYESLAKVFDCEIVVVEATYDLKQLNGEDAEEIEMSEEAKRKAAFSEFLNMLGE